MEFNTKERIRQREINAGIRKVLSALKPILSEPVDKDAENPLVNQCEIDPGLNRWGFLFSLSEPPSFGQLIRTSGSRGDKRLQPLEEELDLARETYPRKRARGVVFETGGHLFVYSDREPPEHVAVVHLFAGQNPAEDTRWIFSLKSWVDYLTQ